MDVNHVHVDVNLMLKLLLSLLPSHASDIIGVGNKIVTLY